MNRARPNSFQPNTGGAEVTPTPTPTALTTPRTWRIEHRDKDGVLLDHALSAFDCDISAEVNKPWAISCTFPYSTSTNSYTDFMRQLWVYDKSDTLVQKFFITQRTRAIVNGERLIRVNGLSLLGLLAYDVIAGPDEYTTVSGALGGVVGAQTNLPAITLGACTRASVAGSVEITLNNVSALAALYKVYEQSGAGGVIWVDPDTLQLEWELDAGAFAGNIAATALNCTSLEVEDDFSALATRVIAQGEGIEASTRITTTVNDLTAQATYGIRAAVVSNREIRKAGTLNEWAASQLAMLHAPKQSVKVGMVDLSAISATYQRSAIRPGQWLRVVDTIFGIEMRVMVHSVKFNLLDPGDISVTVGNALAGREEWADSDDNLAAPGTPRRDSRKSDAKDAIDVLADLVEGLDEAEKTDHGFDHSLREALLDPHDGTDFDDLGIVTSAEFEGADGAYSPENPTSDFSPLNDSSVYSPDNVASEYSPMNTDSMLSPYNASSPLSPSYPNGPLNPTTPGSPFGGQYGKFKPWSA